LEQTNDDDDDDEVTARALQKIGDSND